MAQGPTSTKPPAKKPAARKPAARKAAAKPVAKKAAPVKKAAVRAAPRKPATTANTLKAKASEATATVRKEAAALRDQATTRARQVATQGKGRTTDALDNISKLIKDAAGTVDDKVGSQYGDYTRRAAEAVAGFATNLRGKEVDDIVKDAGAFVKKSPAVAIGAAAALGFVIARLIKAGAEGDAAKPARKAPAKKKTAARKPAAKPRKAAPAKATRTAASKPTGGSTSKA